MEKFSGKVLLMEDEELVAAVGQKLLEAVGLTVDLCKNGEEALALCHKARESGSPYAFAVLDILIAGGMGGIETLRELRRRQDDIKAVATSGYADKGPAGDYSTHGFTAFLPKPFVLLDIRRVAGIVTGQ